MKKMMKYAVRVAMCLLLMVGATFTARALDSSFYAPNSKLASGKWVKIAVKESGIYQITSDDIRSWGLGTDLSQIHVFGYGGAPLSEIMKSDNYADDLPQMPVVRTGDRILFYGQGPVVWQEVDERFTQLQVHNPYAEKGTYFVTNDSRFSDIEIEQAQNEPSGDVVTTYIERLYHEQDIINPGETGRAYLGEDFKSRKSQTFSFDLDGLVQGSTVDVYTAFGALTSGFKSSVIHNYNNSETPLPSTSEDIIDMEGLHTHYQTSYSQKSFKLDGTTKLDYSLTYSAPGTPQLARLDYITVNYERQLSLKNNCLTFGLRSASPNKKYTMSGVGSTTRVWDVTLPFSPLQLNTQAGEGTLVFSSAFNGRREFVAFNESGDYSHPELVGEVTNQDIHGEPTPDMIILAPSAYLEQARRVASLHEQYDGFRVLVLDHEKVFNEFSSGCQDAMAYRRLCKLFYDRGAGEDGHKLGYLLLFGSGHYDNRLIGTNAESLSYPHLLTWQSEVSNDDNSSITTDDFFAVLSDGSSADYSGKMDIAVGRMLAKNVSDARAVVNKLVKYVTKPNYGSWKNQVLMVADDENKGDHMEQSMWFVNSALANGGQDMVYNYVFTDAFNAVSQGGSRAYPEARNKLFTTLKEGVLWWNYVGHASTQNWTGEGLMMRSDVETQLYYRHLPVLYAATCEYCRFDATTMSSGERVFSNANGGAVAVMCPARLAYIIENGLLTDTMGSFVFSRDDDGKQRRIGDILRLAKNVYTNKYSDNYRRFFCFGDPALRLAYAPYTVRVETINGNPVESSSRPVFKAREQVEFAGSIVNADGELATGFNGAIVSTLFGPEQSINTHGYGDMGGAPFTYQDRPNRLAINVDTVIGGRFTVRVIIPSEIDNEYDNYSESMINLYAYDRSDTIEAKGFNSDFYIYGYEDEEVTDTIGPKIITMGLNDDSFVDGSDINESPLFLATVSDESGVNFSSAGIGHSMSLTLDGTNSYNDLVSFYTPMFAQQGTLGSISYQLSDLAKGPHTLRLRVWDVYNNVSEKTINFNVVNGLAPEIADVYCASNPASVEASFYVKHDRPDAVVSVSIEVYDLMGRLVWKTTQAGRSDMYTTIPVTWDLTDTGGRRVPRGIYVYRATISTDGIKEATKAKKLAVTGE